MFNERFVFFIFFAWHFEVEEPPEVREGATVLFDVADVEGRVFVASLSALLALFPVFPLFPSKTNWAIFGPGNWYACFS